MRASLPLWSRLVTIVRRSGRDTADGVSSVVFALTVTAASASAQRPANPTRPLPLGGRSQVYAPNGIVATSQPLASAAGLAVLQRGGNAIDAAVTAAAVLSVTEPMMTGVGGDMFAIIWLAKEKKLVALNASGRAGSLMTRDELIKRGRTRNIPRGGETITVPGALAGWQLLLKTYGTMSLASTLQPAIRHAEQGFPLTPIIADDWAGQATLLARDSAAKATFLPNGKLIAGDSAGDVKLIDPATGAFSTIGNYGNGLKTAGDLVAVKNGTMYATSAAAAGGADATSNNVLIQVNAQTGAATAVGPTGHANVWGVAYANGHVIGFTTAGKILRIDVATGAATVVATKNIEFWGATQSPLVDGNLCP